MTGMVGVFVLVPMGFGIQHRLETGAVKRFPLALRLGKAVGNGIDGSRMMAQAAVASLHLDVFGMVSLLFDAILPGTYAIRFRINGRCWNIRCF